MNLPATTPVVRPVEDHAPRRVGRVATALVVDPDAVSRRFVELALTRDGEFAVEAAESAAAGFEILNRQMIELVVSDTDLADMSGLRFYRLLSQETRLRGIPFVFLSSDRRPEPKIAAFRAGAADYLIKPIHPVELAARALSLVERERRLREQAWRRSYMLAGDLSTITFPDLVNMIELERQSGTLSMVLSQAVGQVFFDGGHIVHATFGNLVGPTAFYRFVAETSGRFEFTPGPCELPGRARTINENATALILEAARRLDSEPAPLVTRRPSPSAAAAAPERSNVDLEPPLEPVPGLAAQLEAGVGDPFTLGELCLWSAAELSRWTRREIGAQRLHVHLIADLPTGVSAILAMAGAPTERWVLGGLEATRKAFGISFFLRRERTVDLVLLDSSLPDGFEPSLKRTPAITILAPPGGELISLGTRARVALDGLLGRLRPPVLLAVGNAAMHADASPLASHAGAVHLVDGVLGQGVQDLRSLVVEGIRRWAARETGPR